MIKDLVKVATKLDSLGLKREADYIDSLIRKIAGNNWGDPYESPMGEHRPYFHELYPMGHHKHHKKEEGMEEMEEGFDISDEDLDLRSQMLEERSEMYSGEPSSLMGEHRPYHHELFPHSRKGRS
jgi:hypothetical protein